MNEIIYSINMSVSIFGLLSCFYILMNNTLNNQKAKCVITTCLAGFFWFLILYSSLLNIHQVSLLELVLNFGLVLITLEWILQNYTEVNIWLMKD